MARHGADGGAGRRGLHALFVCSRNRLRSPTAEAVFATWPGLETASVGVAPDAEEPCSAEWLAWADVIFVMERSHRERLRRRFAAQLRDARLICLDIPDRYDFMQSELVALLQRKVTPHLPRA